MRSWASRAGPGYGDPRGRQGGRRGRGSRRRREGGDPRGSGSASASRPTLSRPESTRRGVLQPCLRGARALDSSQRTSQEIERKQRAELLNPTPARSRPNMRGRVVQRVLHTSPAPPKPTRTGRFGEVEFAPCDERAAAIHRHPHGVPVVTEGHERAAGERLVGDPHRAARERPSACRLPAAAVPRGEGEAEDVEPAEPPAGWEQAAFACETHSDGVTGACCER